MKFETYVAFVAGFAAAGSVIFGFAALREARCDMLVVRSAAAMFCATEPGLMCALTRDQLIQLQRDNRALESCP